MPAQAIALLDHDERDSFTRWSLAAAIVVAAHLGLMASYFFLHDTQSQGSPQAPIVIMDLAPPEPVAPAVQEQDLAPGPETPPPEPEVVEPPKEPDPIVEPIPEEKPVVALPEPKLEVVPEPPKPVEKPPEKVEKKKPVERTAPPKAKQRAVATAAPTIGSSESSAAIASWRDLVVAQLQRNKRYPSGAESRREQGVATLAFSLSRNGTVLSRHVVHSSGNSELDAEVMAMVQRAQPFPSFPPAMTQGTVNLTVPIRFSLR
jgi:protein TonB